VVFAATSAIPGDPARAILGKTATQQQLVEFRKQHGLDDPVLTQYGHWVKGFFSGSWGTSFSSGLAVEQIIRPRLARTLTLAFAGWLIAALIAVPAGLYSARRSGRAGEVVSSIATLSLGAVPEFVVGIFLVLIFAGELGWLPTVSTQVGLVSTPLHAAKAYVLPSCALALTIIPYILRLTRANAREVISEPYIQSAVLRGVGGRSLTLRHVLPNAAPPVANALALQFAGSIGGVVATEYVFGFPGIGTQLVEAVGTRDIPIVQALALLLGIFFVIVNQIADLAVVALTPRLRAVR
jgi:peptide/nickel transport system permease protein